MKKFAKKKINYVTNLLSSWISAPVSNW